jgi:peptide chain release factor 1
VKESIRNKLETTRERFEELEGLMADPDVINDQDQYRDLRKEYARLEPIIRLFQQYETLSDDITAATEMASDSDEDVRQIATVMKTFARWAKKNGARLKRNARRWNCSYRRR